jgi:hypothetical protein
MTEGIIWFNVPKAYEHLKKHGKVYTLRDHVKQHTINKLFSSLDGRPRFKGKVIIETVATIDNISNPQNIKIVTPSSFESIGFLENCALESGFPNVGQWVKQLKHPERTHFLYRVTLLPTRENLAKCF